MLYVYRRRCPNCGSPVSHTPRPLAQRGRVDAAFWFVLKRRIQITAMFLLGLAMGLALGVAGFLLARLRHVDHQILLSVSGWLVGLIAYRRCRTVDVACSRGIGIGTLLGQVASILLFVNARYEFASWLWVVPRSFYGL